MIFSILLGVFFHSHAADAEFIPGRRVSVLHTGVSLHLHRRPELDPGAEQNRHEPAHLWSGFYSTRYSEPHQHRYPTHTSLHFGVFGVISVILVLGIRNIVMKIFIDVL